MSDSFSFDEPFNGGISGGGLPDTVQKTHASTALLGVSAGQFASAITRAFSQATTGGKQFDDVLKGLTLRLSNLAVQNAFKPIARILAGDFRDILSGDDGVIKNLTPFASGGVINTPSYFPLSGGGLGLAGEAGPEAIVPLSRGHGLHTCPQQAWVSFHKTVRAFLDLPDHLMIYSGMALGYEDPDAPINGWRSPRAALDEFASFDGFES